MTSLALNESVYTGLIFATAGDNGVQLPVTEGLSLASSGVYLLTGTQDALL
ncbi:hypothetical protein [Paenibacillus sp. NAIST15-1]|uniref:hypothetical protein n=1 Tax=Paenibacillus sp. NAIST15-1 TaxID=1605994 RepID=UPI000B32E307|nr:hypothetical protein [Paenibacillus sp. NAIST15-1]